MGGNESLVDALAAQLGKFSGLEISRSDWRLDALPDWLLMNFRVVDERGKDISMSRDLAALQQKLAPQVTGGFRGLTTWTIAGRQSPRGISRTCRSGWKSSSGDDLYGYPALVDEKTSVALRLLEWREVPPQPCGTG